MDSSKQFKIGAMLSYFSIALNIIAGLIYTPWMVRQIGQSDYGLYTLANSLIAIFMVDFGLSAATTRFMSKYIAEKRIEKIQSFLSTIYKLYLIIDAVIFVILLVVFFSVDVIYKNLTPIEIEKFKVVYCIAAIYSLINFPCVTFNGILTAYEKFIPLKTADIIYRISVIIITVFALSLGLGLYALVAINAFCGLLSVFYKFLFVRKNVKISIFNKIFDKALFKKIFMFSVWATIGSLAARLVFNITPTIMGITAKNASAEIAIFGIVATLEGYIYTMTTVLSNMFLPKISRILLEDNVAEKLTNFAVKIGRIQYFINGVLVLGFAVVGKEFISLWMGEGYTNAYYALVMIIVPSLFFNVMLIAEHTLLAKNLVKYQALISVVTGIVNVIFVFALTSKFGVIGAGASIGIAYTVRVAALMIVTKKKTEIKLSKIFKECFIRLSAVLIVCLVVCFALTILITKTGWTFLILKALITVIVYIIFFWIFGTNKEEKQYIIITFKNILYKLLGKQ